MAKQRGPVASTFSGRVGNVVGAKLKGGEYVTRSYQPSVKNPNTLRQQISRRKMALASEMGAALSAAVNMGYAKSAASTKMYPRNMFVKDIIPISAGIFELEGTSVVVEYANLPISAKNGLEVAPMGSYATGPGQDVPVFTFTNQASVPLRDGESLGVVVAILQRDMVTGQFKSAVAQGLANTSITPVGGNVDYGQNFNAYAFYKVIPASKNGVLSSQEPWMYPSETSATTRILKN